MCTAKERSLWFAFKQKHVVEEAEMLVNSYHFIRYKCKITHYLASQTLSKYISTIILDDNEKLSIDKVLEVLIAVGTFTSTCSFDSESLQFVTMKWTS